MVGEAGGRGEVSLGDAQAGGIGDDTRAQGVEDHREGAARRGDQDDVREHEELRARLHAGRDGVALGRCARVVDGEGHARAGVRCADLSVYLVALPHKAHSVSPVAIHRTPSRAASQGLIIVWIWDFMYILFGLESSVAVVLMLDSTPDTRDGKVIPGGFSMPMSWPWPWSLALALVPGPGPGPGPGPWPYACYHNAITICFVAFYVVYSHWQLRHWS